MSGGGLTAAKLREVAEKLRAHRVEDLDYYAYEDPDTGEMRLGVMGADGVVRPVKQNSAVDDLIRKAFDSDTQ